jgi:ferredoxin
MALKYDPSNFIRVKVKKPLGLNLEEVMVNEPKGLYVCDVNDGNAKASGRIYKGLLLIEVNGMDVKYKDFDGVMDILVNSPNDTLELAFIDPRDVSKGPATLKVNLNDGKQIEIKTLKGTLLRPLLLDAKVELYPGTAKLTNCGGGGSCGTCVVSITENKDWEERPSFESKKLKKYDPSARLSCNTIIEGDAVVTINPKKIM